MSLANGCDPWPGRPRAVILIHIGHFSVTPTSYDLAFPSTASITPPSLSMNSASFTRSGRWSTTHCAPIAPTSSSAVARKIRSRDRPPPERLTLTIAAASSRPVDFMSSAPRP